MTTGATVSERAVIKLYEKIAERMTKSDIYVSNYESALSAIKDVRRLIDETFLRSEPKESVQLDFPRPDSRSVETDITMLGRVRYPDDIAIARSQVLNQCYMIREQIARTMESLGVPPAGSDYEDVRAMLAFSYPTEKYTREISLVSSSAGESVTIKFTRRKS